MFKKAGILILCGFLAQCSNNNNLMDRPIHTNDYSLQNEEYRLLPMDGSYNTRELGGYKTKDGKSVKWGVLYRSDKLSDISSADQEYIQSLGIKRIVDFRSITEKTENPDLIPEGISYVEMPIEVDGAIRTQIEDILRGNVEGDVKSFLIDANKEFITDYKSVYSKFIKDLINSDGPTLFHCTAGKDRAGFAAAITLIALGVPKEVVIDDYMKTNTFTADRIDDMLDQIKLMSLFQADVEILRPLLGVEQEYIEMAFKTAEENYGSLENYIREGLEISDKEIIALRSLLLEG
ncbi:tyrosine-protein phosphatase [Gammaproteobacteria bacterium]|nr:tyrosine-protein phosphatase [Gammaproteobacteria bacterium]MDB9842040.1 tyrosine-protein phosphatase [Gammaproteobacteria bacterium]